MTNAKIGTVVHTVVDPRINNGSDVACGLVTMIKENDGDESVNVRVFLDTGADLRLTNVKLMSKRPVEDSQNVNTDASGTQRVAWKG